MRRLLVPLLALTALIAGCSDDGDPVTTGDTTTPASTDGVRYQGALTVLESPDHGPQLCSAVAQSYPPQCGGPDVHGWDWDAVDDEESANGTIWGYYLVVGTWDGEAFTLTEPPRRPGPGDEPVRDESSFASPCPEPDGGWQVVGQAKATDEAMRLATDYARAQPDVGGVWLDQSINPAAQREPVDETAMNDPTKLVLNVSFTGDLDRHEAEIREIWGGPLCVSEAPVSAAELADIRAQVEAEVGPFVSSSTDEVRGRIRIGVFVDDGLQRRLDDRFGPGLVEVETALEPVDA